MSIYVIGPRFGSSAGPSDGCTLRFLRTPAREDLRGERRTSVTLLALVPLRPGDGRGGESAIERRTDRPAVGWDRRNPEWDCLPPCPRRIIWLRARRTRGPCGTGRKVPPGPNGYRGGQFPQLCVRRLPRRAPPWVVSGPARHESCTRVLRDRPGRPGSWSPFHRDSHSDRVRPDLRPVPRSRGHPGGAGHLALLWQATQGIFYEFDTAAILLLSTSVVVLGVAMLRAPAFGRGLGGLTLALGAVAFVGGFIFGVTSLFAALFVIPVFVVLPILLGWTVYKLSKSR